MPLPGQPRHISNTFDQELEAIHSRILMMGELALGQVRDVLTAVKDYDLRLARKVDARDAKVNDLELGIDSRCTDVLARRNPNAGDLRFVLVAIRFVTDCERIGDEASRVARHLSEIKNAESIAPCLDRISDLGNRAIKQMEMVLQAFRDMDSAEVYDVFKLERELDHAYHNHIKWLMTRGDQSDTESVGAKLFMFNILHALERVGDHSANMAEQVVYMVEGVELRHYKELQERLDEQG